MQTKSVIACYCMEFFLFVLVSGGIRACIRDAVDYKRNKNKIRQFYKETPVIRHLLRIYPLEVIFAPRHYVIFQILRIINIVLLIMTTSLYIFLPDA